MVMLWERELGFGVGTDEGSDRLHEGLSLELLDVQESGEADQVWLFLFLCFFLLGALAVALARLRSHNESPD